MISSHKLILNTLYVSYVPCIKCPLFRYPYLRGLPRHRPRVPPAVVVPVSVAAHAAAATAAEPEAGNPPVIVPPAVRAGGTEMEVIRTTKCIKVP